VYRGVIPRYELRKLGRARVYSGTFLGRGKFRPDDIADVTVYITSLHHTITYLLTSDHCP